MIQVLQPSLHSLCRYHGIVSAVLFFYMVFVKTTLTMRDIFLPSLLFIIILFIILGLIK